MTWATIILAVMAILAFLVSVFTFFRSREAFVLSRQANKLASGANAVAEQARKNAKAAPAEAERRKLYRVIHDQVVRMHKAITQAWVHDQSRPVGSPPHWYPDALRQARSAHAELPEGDLASLLAGELMNYENVASA